MSLRAALEDRVESIKQHFEGEAEEFDRIIVALIPDYSRMVEALIAALPFDSCASIKVIDLGCGTGTVALSVLRAFPNAHITCLDLAENMLAMARIKLANHQHVRYVAGDFTDFCGEYDAVVSSLALHHLAAGGASTNVYTTACVLAESSMVARNPQMPSHSANRFTPGLK